MDAVLKPMIYKLCQRTVTRISTLSTAKLSSSCYPCFVTRTKSRSRLPMTNLCASNKSVLNRYRTTHIPRFIWSYTGRYGPNRFALSKGLQSLNFENVTLRRDLMVVQKFATDSKQNSSKPDIALWKRAAFVAVIGGLVGYSFWSVKRQRKIEEEKVRYEEFKKAELGGDWVLTDQYGKQRSSTEFRGQWILMYFGFTHCPDICPEELEKLIKIVKMFDANSKLPNMLPVFITLDPDRDNPSVIKDYLKDLKYPRMLGFTGTEEEIRQVAKKFRAYFKKGPVDEDNDYIVDHTIIIYLINPKGEFVNYFDRSKTAERVVKSVTEHVKKYTELEKAGKS